MLIERKITINNIDYFLAFKLKYNDMGGLSKKNGDYFDLGDLSIMIDFFEENYDNTCKYEKCTPYMNDIIYLYDRFPFVDYIKDITYDKKGQIKTIGYIEKEEIETYIKNNNIKINKWNKDRCLCPNLYGIKDCNFI